MRYLILAPILLATTAAHACPSGHDLVFVREADGMEFTPNRYGARQDRWPVWHIYRGKVEGRTLYWATGDILGAVGTSGTSPPTEGIRWSYDLGRHEHGALAGTIHEGPLLGVWRVKCDPSRVPGP